MEVIETPTEKKLKAERAKLEGALARSQRAARHHLAAKHPSYAVGICETCDLARKILAVRKPGDRIDA